MYSEGFSMEAKHLNKHHYKFEILPLPYDYNSLEPYIDTLTMQIHHDKHLQTYVNNLNNALKDYPALHTWTLEQLIFYSNKLPNEIKTAVKNNAGGVYNHNFYFYHMANPNNIPNQSDLLNGINNVFGSYEQFKAEFKKQALGVFGSGYTWLCTDKYNRLQIVNTANQDTPLTLGLRPVMVIDVWEHAYYLKHYNVRADYIEDWFQVAFGTL
ncbi:37s ribosomal protein s26 mitochondrial [Holotrichia oblita]|nr:37s ribosomal protein s26 mitochondrial [Holotrichia oblita]